jgi:hypothetical protein
MHVANPNGNGGFRPGQTGNPGGRPRAAREATIEARRFAVEAIHALVRTMRRASNDAVRIAAARELLDRALGKAPQNVDLSVTKQISSMTLDELQQLEAAITGVAAIDGPKDRDLIASIEDEALGPRVILDDPEPDDCAAPV